jgi:acetyl-CoA acetyltransferase
MAESRPTGQQQFKAPYGGSGVVSTVAMYARRHMHQYGTRREHLGMVALNSRRNAVHNPRALFRQRITMEEYLAAPMIADPFGLLDCDVPADMGMALVLTTAERARDLKARPVYVEAAAHGLGHRASWEQIESIDEMANYHASRNLWERTGLTPRDLDVGDFYDGFSWLTLSWLEALGICGRGESGPFVGGGRIYPEGELPLNTHGGNLSEGRVHGAGHILEAVQQLRGEAGPRQVKDARIAVATNGGGATAGGVVFVRE